MEDSSFGRLLGVFVAPGKTFRSLAARPTWALPLLVLSLTSAGFGCSFPSARTVAPLSFLISFSSDSD